MSEQLGEVAGDDSSKIDIVPWRVPTVKVGCRRRLPDRELIQLAERVSTLDSTGMSLMSIWLTS